jgi:fengycin family lipopeptide synthetase E
MKLSDSILTHIDFKEFEKAAIEKPVFEIFTEAMRRNPAKIAITDATSQLTYKEVYEQATQIASALKTQTLANEPVGIALQNGVYFPVAMLGILAAGRPYVPLDIDLPKDRNERIIQHSGVKTIVANSTEVHFSEAFNYLYIDQLTTSKEVTFELNASPNDIAYIIYTSGSTGIPKGVYQNQRNLLHDVMQYINTIHLNENDRLSLLYSPSVNGAIRDIYGALLTGASLHIKNLKSTGLFDLATFISQEQITIYHAIPNIFRTFLQLKNSHASLTSVRLIYLAGDRIFNADVNLYKTNFTDNCLLYVGIGATEIATIYRQWLINKNTFIHQELIPLGFAVEDREMTICDETQHQVTDGETGEICVKSKYIALGYWNNAEQTKQSFTIEGEYRTYFTGDLGKINEEGSLSFIGRNDHQVKINGHRIEISEIEGVLMTHPAISRCAVIVQNNSLLAFYIGSIPEAEIKIWIAEKLPQYMVPKRCLQVSEIPLLHNFKNDYKALKTSFENSITKPQPNPFPNLHHDLQTPLFETLKTVWGKYLDENSFQKNTSWKEAGGNSIEAVNFLVSLEIALGETLPTDWIHGAMKPLEIYQNLHDLNLSEKAAQENIIYYFSPYGGISEKDRAFIKKLAVYFTVKIIAYPNFKNIPLENNIDEIYNQFIASQITNYNQPNIGFVGKCFGGRILSKYIYSNPLQQYSFIATIEKSSSSQTIFSPITIIYKKIKAFFSAKHILFNSYYFLFSRFSFFRNAKFAKKSKFYTQSVDYLVFNRAVQLQKVKLDLNFKYFHSENISFQQPGKHWEACFKSIERIPLLGSRKDMISNHNSQLIIAKLLEEIALKQTENTTNSHH